MGWLDWLFGPRASPARTTTTAAPAGQRLARPPRPPPADWADEDGWDAFHTATPAPRRHSPIALGLQYVASFREKGFRRVWFPGAGTSAAPRAFAELGFEVVSSDFSAVAT